MEFDIPLFDIADTRDYGVTCDGTTDDTEALQRAFDSGKSMIVLPEGVCRTTATVYGDASQTLVGMGENYDRLRGTSIFYDALTGNALQFPRAFDIAGIETATTNPVVETAQPHGITAPIIMFLDNVDGGTFSIPDINGPKLLATRIDDTHFSIQREDASDIACTVSPTPNTGQGSIRFSRLSGVRHLSLFGRGPSYPTRGIKIGLGDRSYAANSFTGAHLYIQGFGLGYDNGNSDASSLNHSGLVGNGVNFSTASNDFFQMRSVSHNDAETWSIRVGGSGAGLHMTGGVSANNPQHIRVENGARLLAKGVWFEGIKGEGLSSYVDAGADTKLAFIDCHRTVSGPDLVFCHALSGPTGTVKFLACELNLDFDVWGTNKPVGEGQTGQWNGAAYTAMPYGV